MGERNISNSKLNIGQEKMKRYIIMVLMNIFFIPTVMAHEQTTKLSGQSCEVDYAPEYMYDEEGLKVVNSSMSYDYREKTGLIFATQCNKGDVTTTQGRHNLENLVSVCDLNSLKIVPGESESYPLVVCVYTGKQLPRRPLE
tara:strand:- start:47 stop:472 length:426 start_codon:yes stop_codon:yes gene_type:complete